MTTGAAEFDRGFTDRLLMFANAAANAGLTRDIFDAFVLYVRALGYDDVSVSYETEACAGTTGTAWSTLPAEHVQILADVGFDGADAVHRAARRRAGPLVWSRSDWPGTRNAAAARIASGLEAIRIETGATLVIWGPSGSHVVIDAFGPAEPQDAVPVDVLDRLFLAASLLLRALDRRNATKRRAALTAREVETLELSARGLSARAIALRMGVVEPTVKFHLGSAKRKLGARNKVEAVARYAMVER